jgi:hypothetical protein
MGQAVKMERKRRHYIHWMGWRKFWLALVHGGFEIRE